MTQTNPTTLGDAPSGYVRGEVTVITNETGAQLMIPQIRVGGGASLMMEPGEAIDLEDVTRPALIEHSGINVLAKNGMIKFHPKNSNPAGKARETLTDGTAPMNVFDENLNKVIERDEKRAKETEATALRRG